VIGTITIRIGGIEIAAIEIDVIETAIGTPITVAGIETTAKVARMAITASTVETRVGMATTVITSINKPNSRAIKMDFIPARATPSVDKVTTRNVLTTTETQIQATTLRTAIEASLNRPIARDFCRAISRDTNSTEVTTTAAVAGRGNVVKQTVSLRWLVTKMPRVFLNSRHFLFERLSFLLSAG
jgi:hypothetical protein